MGTVRRIMHNTIKDLPEDERPYEKYIKYGPKALSDAELLAVIIKTGTKDKSCIELSRELLRDSDNRLNLLSLCRKEYEDFVAINGIGRAKAVTLKCIAEISERIACTYADKNCKLDNPKIIADLYYERFRHLKNEVFLAVFLDTGNARITDRVISTGTVNCSIVSSRDVFLWALKYEAVKVVVIHNHPSGNPSPSNEDIMLTEKLFKAGELLDVRLLDHIIIGDRKYVSLKERNLL